MGLFSWIVLGAIAGWAAGVLLKDRERGCLTNIVVGIAGAIFAGAVYTFATGKDYMFTLNIPSMGVATLGAVVVLALLNRVSGRDR